ncbi:TIGR02281 family clan AA aspartic protease [Sphingomonas lutea]|uniref:TIGR02281 family clan AA aspartic protease n=1 Tax=Sphingomonas lutea TaxID=1045317 RepID=A0A7G9SJ12_9SPHN|nr:TIGR02281 family clan AA aspartic protease [Sphingomonas lutea]QNN67837.1 TIGR02281 family clan AA aspartic protease [Sphingomonas lutea]
MERGALVFLVLAGLFSVMVGGSLSTAPPAAAGNSAGRVQVIDGSAQPLVADVASIDGDAVQLERQDDGHFYADVDINGAIVRALVDTGATGIALSREDARAAGLAVSVGMHDVIGRGADGDVRGEHVTLDRVTLGHRSVANMPAVVLNAGEETLLGQTFLSTFESVEIRGDRMVLR